MVAHSTVEFFYSSSIIRRRTPAICIEQLTAENSFRSCYSVSTVTKRFDTKESRLMSDRVCRWGILSTANIARKNWLAIRNTGNAVVTVAVHQ
jgi:hypothetical protein